MKTTKFVQIALTLSLVGSLAASPCFAQGFRPPSAAAQEAVTKYSVVGIREGDTLKLRRGPGASYPVVATLANGVAGVEVQGSPVMNGNDDWVHVTVGDTEGWTRPKYLALTRTPFKPAEESTPATPSVTQGNDTLVKTAVVLGGIYLAYKLFNSDSSSSSSSSSKRDDSVVCSKCDGTGKLDRFTSEPRICDGCEGVGRRKSNPNQFLFPSWN